MSDVRVVIADPDALARRTVREALNEADGVAAIAGAGCGREAVELARYHRPDVLITEVTHPDVEADELCRRLALEAPGTAVVVLCAVEDPELAVRCLRAGAVGYLTKDQAPERLAEALRGVLRGEAALSRRMAAHLIADVRDTQRRMVLATKLPHRERLTPRQLEILQLIAAGETTTEIARRLFLSPETVRWHVKAILRKLKARTRAEAAAALREVMA